MLLMMANSAFAGPRRLGFFVGDVDAYTCSRALEKIADVKGIEVRVFTDAAMNLNDRPFSREEAVVLVGHGTDHPAWTAYFALKSILRQSCRSKIFVAMIEGKPSRSQVFCAISRCGIKKVRLIPFTLVAGVHFQEDIAGDGDSWKAAFESIGVTVEVETQGIGYRETIIDIFVDHIQDALSVIPGLLD